MKTKLFWIFLTFTFCLTVFLPISIARDYTTFSLPEGATKRLGKGSITGEVKYSPDGTQLAVASFIGVWIYDAQTGEELNLLTGHTSYVNSVSFSPDGQTLASGSDDDTVRLWDVATGDPLRTLTGHTSGVLSVSFSPDGQTLTSGGGWQDRTIRLWDVATGAHLRTLTGHTSGVLSVLFSPDGQTIATGSSDDTIRLWDVNTGDTIRTLTGHTSGVNSVSFSPDGETLASGSGGLLSDGYTIRLWDVATGDPLRTLTGHTWGVSSVSFSPDGETVASGSWDGTLRLWDVATGDPLRTLTGHTGWVSSVSFSPDGQTLASGSDDDTVRLWDVATSENINIIEGSGHIGRVESVSFSPDGNTLTSVLNNWNWNWWSQYSVVLWDVSTGETTKVFDTTGLIGVYINAASFSPDFSTLATVQEEFSCCFFVLWDVSTGETTKVFGDTTDNHLFFSPDGTTFASASGNQFSEDNTIRLWDVSTGENIKTFEGHTSSVISVSFSPEGTTLASGSRDSTLRLWDVSTGNHLRTLTGHTSYVNSVSFSPDGQTLASGSDDQTIRLWNVATGDPIRTLTGHTWGVNSVSFSPDGQILASGSWDGTLRLWDVSTGNHLRTLTGHTSYVNSVSFSPDGQTLASGSNDGTVLLWDIIGVGGSTQPIADKDIVVKFQIEENGKEVTIYYENEDMLVYTFGVPGETPELEYKGQILAEVNARTVLWGEGVESLMDLSTALMNEDSAWWTTSVDEQNTGDEAITKAANSPESSGFVRVFASTGFVSQSVYIFRTGGWEYLVESTAGRPLNIPESEIDDYQSYSLTILLPDGEVHRLWEGQPVEEPTPPITDETNNTRADATPLPIDGSLTEKIDPGDDVDYFSVEVDEAGELIVWTTGSLDTVGELQNSEGTTLAANDDVHDDFNFDVHDDFNFTIVHDVEPGIYYIKVESYEAETGDYTIYAGFSAALLADVNGDGVVDVLDLILVAANFGNVNAPPTMDVNGDGEVNREDILAVLDALEAAAGAPAAVSTATSLQRWIDHAKQRNTTDADFQKAITVLENLLITLTEIETVPKQTALLANYPNPFNPETWIPYQLAKDADVTLRIYAVDGTLVRTVSLGHQPAGIYQHRSRAAYWDGKNTVGEAVASGVYFYTITAGDFNATRKMLIRK